MKAECYAGCCKFNSVFPAPGNEGEECTMDVMKIDAEGRCDFYSDCDDDVCERTYCDCHGDRDRALRFFEIVAEWMEG